MVEMLKIEEKKKKKEKRIGHKIQKNDCGVESRMYAASIFL